MKVGSLVICIYKANGKGKLSETQQEMKRLGYVCPKYNEIYTVRGFNLTRSGIYLEELINPPVNTIYGFKEVVFSLEAFREIQPQMDLTEIIECQNLNIGSQVIKV